jgi:hypothetical protein
MQDIQFHTDRIPGNVLHRVSGGLAPRFCFVLLTFVCLWTIGAAGQGAAGAIAASPDKPADTTSSNVQAISLDLVVHDKGRQPVSGLKPEDLQVSDNGTPVQLKDLHLVSGATDTEHVVTIVSEHFAGRLDETSRP